MSWPDHMKNFAIIYAIPRRPDRVKDFGII